MIPVLPTIKTILVTTMSLGLLLGGGCATSPTKNEGGAFGYQRPYNDATPLEAVDSLLFAYREGDYDAVYHLTKPIASQTAKARKEFASEIKGNEAWTPALWQINTGVAYTGDRTSADVTASVLSDLEGYLYKDSMRFYCFMDGEHWKIAQHDFEGDSVLLAPLEPGADSEHSP